MNEAETRAEHVVSSILEHATSSGDGKNREKTSMNNKSLDQKVKQVAEKTLHDRNYVCAIDILLGIGYLQPVHIDDWKRGRVPYLEKVICANLSKISYAMKSFRVWARQKGLNQSETSYLLKTQNHSRALQFSKSGDSNIELAYRTHYVSPTLTDKKQQKLKENFEKPAEVVVFSILKDSKCDLCEKELFKDSFLYKEQDKALCLKCAKLDELTFLPAGDAKLTRQAKKHSKTYAVVVRFSRARKRYERQGLLVEESALKQAESENN